VEKVLSSLGSTPSVNSCTVIKHSSQHDFSSEWRKTNYAMMQAGITAQLHCLVLTCNVTFKGIRGNTGSRVEHPRSHRAALLAARYTVLTSECSCYIYSAWLQSVAGLMKLLIIQFSPTSRHFISLRSSYSQHTVLRHPQSVFLP
jgi:hypothetical protein